MKVNNLRTQSLLSLLSPSMLNSILLRERLFLNLSAKIKHRGEINYVSCVPKLISSSDFLDLIRMVSSIPAKIFQKFIWTFTS